MRYELDFLSPGGRSILFEINVIDNTSKKTRDENIKKQIRPILYKDYLLLLLENYTYDELYSVFTNNREVPIKELEKIAWHTDLPKYQCIGVSKISDCFGCRDEVFNQLGHMESGGCLYISSDCE